MVVLSGCSGLGGGGADIATSPGTGAADATATGGGSPPTADGETATPAAEGLPPGVSEDGVENLTALRRAHAAALNGTGFASELVVQNALADSETDLSATQRLEAAVGEGGAPYRYYRNNSGGLSEDFEKTTWGNGSVDVSRRTTYPAYGDAETTYDATRDTTGATAGPGTTLSAYLRFGEFDVAANGDRYRLTATGPNESLDVNVTRFGGTVLVDSRGRIHSATLDLAFTTDRGTFEAHVEYDLSTEPADVAKPDWVPAALDEASAIAVEATVEGDAVAVTNTGREPIPAGATLSLSEQTDDGWAGRFTTLDEPIAPGETVYVWNEGGETQVSRSPPSDADLGAGPFKVQVVVDGEEVATDRTDDGS